MDDRCLIPRVSSWSWQRHARSRLKTNLLLVNPSAQTAYGMELSSVTVVFLPPNTTAKLQCMDAGIIASFKSQVPASPAGERFGYERTRITEQYLYDGPVQGNEVDKKLLLAWRPKRCYSKLISAHRVIARPYDHSKIKEWRWWPTEHQPADTNVSATHPQPDEPERLHLLHRRGRHGGRRANCHSPDHLRSGRCVSVHGPESSNFQILESTRKEFTTMQTEISADGKFKEVRSIILMLGEHPDLERNIMGGMRTLQQLLRDDLREGKEK